MNKKKTVYFSLSIVCILSVIFIVFYLLRQKGGSLLSKSDETIDFVDARSRTFFPGKDGYYYKADDGLLKFFDFKTKQIAIVCNKANCKHLPWDEATPEEERCDAFITAYRSVFVYDNKLYVMQYNDNLSMTVYRSELDRSHQELVADFGVNLLSRVFIKNNKMYYSNIIPEETVDEAGFPTVTGRQTNYISMLDLKTKNVSKLTDSLIGYLSSISFLAMQGNKIYYRYDYFENALKPDNSNWDEAKMHTEYYSFDVDSKETMKEFENVKSDDLIVLEYIRGETLYYVTADSKSAEKQTGGQSPDALYCSDGTTTNLLLSDVFISAIYDDKVFYTANKNEDNTYYYDLKTSQSVELKTINNMHYVIIGESDEGFLVRVTDSTELEQGSSFMCYITKDDYYNGHYNFIRLD